MKDGWIVTHVAGFSLGEYSALIHSGAITFEDGVRLLKVSGISTSQLTIYNIMTSRFELKRCNWQLKNRLARWLQ
jgi:acyl transferase domain-containing protein